MSVNKNYALKCPHCGAMYKYKEDSATSPHKLFKCRQCLQNEPLSEYILFELPGQEKDKETGGGPARPVKGNIFKPKAAPVRPARDDFETSFDMDKPVRPEEKRLTEFTTDEYTFEWPPVLVNHLAREMVRLRTGRFTFGRYHPDSPIKPDIGLSKLDEAFSRLQLIFEVIKTSNGYVCTVENHKNKNRTYLDEVVLEDSLVYKVSRNMTLRVGRNKLDIMDIKPEE